MDLKDLIRWTEHTRKVQKLRNMVRRDPKGIPIESDVTVGLNLLAEIKKRALLVEEHKNKALKFESDIIEYLQELEKRGIVYRVQDLPQEKEKAPSDKKDQERGKK